MSPLAKMKQRLFPTLAGLLVLGLTTPSAKTQLASTPEPASQNPAKASPAALSAAVLNFQTSEEKLASKGAETALLLGALLSSSSDLIMVERQELEKLMGEQELGLSGNVTQESAAQVGKLTGAKILVTGRLFAVGSKFFLVAKIMSTETSRVYGETVSFEDLGSLDKAVAELAPKIQDVVAKRADTLVAKVESNQERLERFRKLIAGKKLPSVSVSIKEQHINHAVIDPAAQTELLKTFQELGFEIIDAESPQKPADILITGEAISEAGARHGNFISCRSRVEIKATQRSTGKLLLSDRQNDIAIDIAESVAGKIALQNAALKLVERILPKVVE
jgi:hypothetical protein